MVLLILNLKFLFLLILSLILVGAIAYERHMRAPEMPIRTDIFFGLSATVFGYLSSELQPTTWTLAAHFTTAAALIIAVVLYKNPKLAIGLGKATFLLVVVAVGLLVGTGLIVPAASLSILTLVYFLVADAWVGSKVLSEYSVTIEIEKMSALGKVEDMLKKFQIYISRKLVVKNDAIHVQLTYTTTQPTQSLFMKKLFTVEGLGEVSCL